MTPATVQATFARAGVPVVRYAKGAQLCGAQFLFRLKPTARIRAIFERILR